MDHFLQRVTTLVVHSEAALQKERVGLKDLTSLLQQTGLGTNVFMLTLDAISRIQLQQSWELGRSLEVPALAGMTTTVTNIGRLPTAGQH